MVAGRATKKEGPGQGICPGRVIVTVFSVAAAAVFILFAASAWTWVIPANLHTLYRGTASAVRSAVFQRHYRHHFIIVVTAVISDSAVPAHLDIELSESEAFLIGVKFKRVICLITGTGFSIDECLNSIVDAHMIVYGLIELVYFQGSRIGIAAKGLPDKFLYLLM